MYNVDYKKLKKEIEKDAKEHGGLKYQCLTSPDVIDSVDEFISATISLGIHAIKASEEGLIIDRIVLKTSNELNQQLKDIPENKEVWEKIYDKVPICILCRTTRMDDLQNPNVHFMTVFTDLVSEAGKKEARFLLDNILK